MIATENGQTHGAVLDTLEESGKKTLFPPGLRVAVGAATCGMAAGAGRLMAGLSEAGTEGGEAVRVCRVGCIGSCHLEPIVLVQPPMRPASLVGPVDPAEAGTLVGRLMDGTLARDMLLGEVNVARCLDLAQVEDTESDGRGSFFARPFQKRQLRIATRNCGIIDPESLAEYVAAGGYRTAASVLAALEPEAIIDVITHSGLRGRGGGGFLTGRKWQSCRKAPSDERFVICNADEGDPGAYMDRSILEGDPHSVIEGMIIGAFAIGAAQGFIYVRNEYPLAVARFEKALADCRAHGILGPSVLGTELAFDIAVVRGGGAFVCGESTALMASIEGRIGEPRAKYIHTVEQGLWDRPSNLNNVETWANVPAILAMGADCFRRIGTAKSTGTKVFSLVGDVERPGLIEVPMGITLREVVYDIGGGIKEGRGFRGVQTGGPSGGCLPERLLDLAVDFDTLTAAGSMMGSGGMIVMDDSTCMVDVARYFIDFLCEESCGKCVPCREGLGELRRILTAITEGKGTESDLGFLEELSVWLQDASLCQLGGSAPNPVLSTLRYFKDDYEAHIREKRCPAGVCRALIRFDIDPALCDGCHLCFTVCPQGAIEGKPKGPHTLIQATCSRCGACVEVCKPGAVRRVE